MTMSYSEVLLLKKAVDEVFHLNVHFHDACGGQYFSLDDEPSEELVAFIVDYFNRKNISVRFACKNQTFTLE